MNVVKEIQKINELELKGNGQGSWHDDYKDSAHIFVGGLPFNLTEGDVIAIFSQYGEIGDINLPRDRETQKPRGFAFLMYLDQRSTVLAVDNLNGAKVLGRTLRVDHTKNYRQSKILNEETGEMEDADEERMNALPQLIGGDGQPAAIADAPDAGDEEDPMAAYIRESKRARLVEDQSSSASGSKPKKDKHRSKENRRAEKEEKHRRKEEKRAEKESRKHSSSSRRRDEDRSSDARNRPSNSKRDDSPSHRQRRSPSPDPRDRRVTSVRERERSPRSARPRSPSPGADQRPRRSPPPPVSHRRSPSPPPQRYPDDDRHGGGLGGDRRHDNRGSSSWERDTRPPYAERDGRERRDFGRGGKRDERAYGGYERRYDERDRASDRDRRY